MVYEYITYTYHSHVYSVAGFCRRHRQRCSVPWL